VGDKYFRVLASVGVAVGGILGLAVPFYAYAFFAATMFGWIWALLKVDVRTTSAG
jgi:hypothetical protein